MIMHPTTSLFPLTENPHFSHHPNTFHIKKKKTNKIKIKKKQPTKNKENQNSPHYNKKSTLYIF
jgi:hypothetical protein